jgi:type IX secretion system PorP/SprF family membrane protein
MKKIIIILAIVIGSLQMSAQRDALFSQYMFNKLLLNPAYAGSKEVLAIDILNRYQWVGIDGAPQTLTFAAHTALRNRKIGLGIYAYRDVLGPLSNSGFMGTYSYRLIMDKSRILSFGIQIGLRMTNFSWLEGYTQQVDPNFEEEQRLTPDANFGIYYTTSKFFVGLSSKQLFESMYGKVRSDVNLTYMRFSRHFYGMGGFVFPLSEDFALRPSILAKYVYGAPVQMDFNVSMVYKDRFWVGLSYRTEEAVVLLTEFRLARYLRIGYSFDMYLNELQMHNKGTHEIRLGFDFELFQPRMLTPRYFF